MRNLIVLLFATTTSGAYAQLPAMSGDHDFIDFNNVLIKKWTSGKKQFSFTPIPKAGHLLWIDQPQAFTK